MTDLHRATLKAEKELKTLIKNAKNKQDLKIKLVEFIGIEGVIGFGSYKEVYGNLDKLDAICNERFPDKK